MKILSLLLISFVTLLSYTSAAKKHSSINMNKSGVALDGHDVVAYFNKGQKKAVKGSKEFNSTFKNATFYFLNKENLEKFNSNPEKFIPAYGGYCAWAVEESSDFVPVNYDSFIISRDKGGKERLLLFYNRFFVNTKKKWNKKSKKIRNGSKTLISIADKKWSEMIKN